MHGPRQGFDVANDALQDINLTIGFLNSLKLLLRVQEFGLCWLAVPCNSFSFMSISQHMRSFLKPYGDLTFAFVQAGNCICTRSCMLILVALARNVVWMIETPLRSSLDVWPFLNHIIHQQWLGCHRTSW